VDNAAPTLPGFCHRLERIDGIPGIRFSERKSLLISLSGIEDALRTTPQSRRNTVAIVVAILGGVGLLAVGFLPVNGSASPAPITIKISQNATWGPTLSLNNGDTLYRLAADTKDRSRCTGKCATVWIPVALSPGQKTPIGKGISGLGSFIRAKGVRQATLDGIPLYRLVGEKPGQVGGSKDTWGQWWSINPSHPTVAPTKVKTGSGGSGGTTTTAPPTTTTTHPVTTTTTHPVTPTTSPPTTTTTSGGGIAY
jgi:predicted lipoprotein with Yx(FWY)xxD motif